MELFLGKIVRETLESRGYEVAMKLMVPKPLELFQKTNPDILHAGYRAS